MDQVVNKMPTLDVAKNTVEKVQVLANFDREKVKDIEKKL